MHPTLSALATALAIAALPACLDVKKGAANGDATSADTTTPDTTPDSAPDTTPDVAPDTFDPCANVDCDDENECTIDVCNAGTCTHTPLVGDAEAPPDRDPAEPPECLDDSGCNDNDPCTTDSCLVRPGTCGSIAWGSCTYVRDPLACPTPACSADMLALCRDNNPCTLDGCEPDFGCTATPLGNGLCDSRCNPNEAVPVSEIGNTILPGDALTTRGTLGMEATGCPECEGCACTGRAALIDGRFTLPLLGDEGPTCTSRVGAPVCAPLLFDVRYIAWGTAAYETQEVDPDPGGVTARPNALDLAGYCLDTALESATGVYDATLSIESVKAVTFTATLHSTSEDELVMTISDVTNVPPASISVAVAAFAAQAPRVTRDDDGRLNFGLDIPWLDARVERENVFLFGRESSLVGSLGPLFHDATSPDDTAAMPAEDTLPYGDLRLVRRAPYEP